MKQTILLFISVFILSSIKAGIIAAPVSTTTTETPIAKFNQFMRTIDAQSFITLTPSKVQDLTGKKMSGVEKLYFKLAQKKVKKQLKKGKINPTDAVFEQMARGEEFNWGVFALCALLGPIGVIIVYLSNYDDPQVARRSAWRGLLTWLGLVAAVGYLLTV